MLFDGPVVLPRLAVAQAWEWERIGPAHPVLGVVDVWVEDDAGERLDELARQALAEPGFYDLRARRVTGRFRDLMLAIANAEDECYGWSTDRRGHDRAMLAVPADRDAVLAIVEDDRLTLESIKASRLVRAVVECLPDFPAADIREFSVPKADYEPGTTGHPAAEQLRRLMAARREASHQLYVATRADGTRQSSLPLTAVDTRAHGRVLTYLSQTPEDTLDITCGPGHPTYITGTLQNTLDALRS
ncbi:ESX secretion-associated protein EspG [Amycolatopsis sp. PS_44_ISF1]|uniref:ESX secretion-associated protein EspG n=1 Tax=Amycolatopsis sp. PS_44_ISF1 TaxID=2974917 RepID=UPI0028DE5A46|nr:ESX secretion-associated protein EspG [Amycolatopsis sp. PS_44_ISF1]MDT8915851.1 ESX secretion-associated protein EspG [Amycolatopsis sp. PS_44_ISF1]